MTEEKLAHFKQLLDDEKARLEKERKQYTDEDRENMRTDASGEMSHGDMNSPADEATELFYRERNQAAIENFDRLLAKVNRALVKMDEGTYGQSDLHGTPIPEARPAVVPYAALTVEQEENTLAW